MRDDSSLRFSLRLVVVIMIEVKRIDQFSKRHRLVHNGGLPKFEVLYGSLNVVNPAEILQNLSYKVQSSKSQGLKPIQEL